MEFLEQGIFDGVIRVGAIVGALAVIVGSIAATLVWFLRQFDHRIDKALEPLKTRLDQTERDTTEIKAMQRELFRDIRAYRIQREQRENCE